MNVFVTGANRGFGLSLTIFFLQKGHCVVASVRGLSQSDELRKLKADFNDSLIIVQMDASDPLSVKEACRLIKETLPFIDILINNAAREGMRCKKIQDVDIHDLETTIKTNLLGPVSVVQGIVPLMEDSAYKIIINISSEAGSLSDIPLKYYGYCMSKAALNMFSRLLARELKPRNFKVLAIHPGWMRTDMGGEEAPLHPLEASNQLFNLIQSLDEADFDDNFVDISGMKMKY
ncbi:SDR family oxidoreductase [Paenibacillus sp. KS-LC4]|uniref:SDR family oxidoreductase n=1 Tax=Paenibacillus sp. KS-LC4 TaxID=2979727 RepID=UPI0030D2C2F6